MARGLSVVVALVRLVMAVVELVRVTSPRHVAAVAVSGLAVLVPRAAWLFYLLPPQGPRRR